MPLAYLSGVHHGAFTLVNSGRRSRCAGGMLVRLSPKPVLRAAAWATACSVNVAKKREINKKLLPTLVSDLVFRYARAMRTLTIHTDGGARGNPGPAAVGAHFQLDGWELKHGRTIGEATNNVAEYTAVLDALQMIENFRTAGEPQFERVTFYLDSELVVRQLLGQYKIKEPTLQELAERILIRLKTLELPYEFTHVRREHNKIADSLVNAALDGKL